MKGNKPVLKLGPSKKKESFVAVPRPPNVAVISRAGINIQTVHIHSVISKYG